jgi:hypothetical protein
MYLPIVLRYLRRRLARLCEHFSVDPETAVDMANRNTRTARWRIFPPHVVVSISEPRSHPYSARGQYRVGRLKSRTRLAGKVADPIMRMTGCGSYSINPTALLLSASDDAEVVLLKLILCVRDRGNLTQKKESTCLLEVYPAWRTRLDGSPLKQ